MCYKGAGVAGLVVLWKGEKAGAGQGAGEVACCALHWLNPLMHVDRLETASAFHKYFVEGTLRRSQMKPHPITPCLVPAVQMLPLGMRY